MNKLVKVWPNIVDEKPEDDTLTVRYDKHDGDWAGKLVRGKIYKAIEEYKLGDKLFYRLEEVDKFPFIRIPSNREVWGNAQYLIDYIEEETPPPVVDSDLSWYKVIYVACQAIVDYIKPKIQ